MYDFRWLGPGTGLFSNIFMNWIWQKHAAWLHTNDLSKSNCCCHSSTNSSQICIFPEICVKLWLTSAEAIFNSVTRVYFVQTTLFLLSYNALKEQNQQQRYMFCLVLFCFILHTQISWAHKTKSFRIWCNLIVPVKNSACPKYISIPREQNCTRVKWFL